MSDQQFFRARLHALTSVLDLKSLPHGADAATQILRDIDWAYAALAEQQRRVAKHHNSFVSINRLPPDVFLNIFHRCHPTAWAGVERLAWIAFSQVCRAWRTLAVRCPTLWTKPDFSRPRFALHVLNHRVRNAPLRIRCEVDPASAEVDDVLEALEAALARLANITKLEISATEQLLRGLFRCFTRPATRLQFLQITVTDYGDRAISFGPDELPKHAPELTALYFNRCVPDPDWHLFSQLHHIGINLHSTPFKMNLSDIYRILKRTPLLWTAHFDHALRIEDRPPQITSLVDRASLLEMEEFEVEDEPISIARLWNHVHIPPGPTANFSSTCDPTTPDDWAALFRHGLCSRTLRSLNLHVEEDNFLEFEAGIKTDAGMELLPMTARVAAQPYRRIFALATRHLPLQDLVTLRVGWPTSTPGVNSCPGVADWLMLFERARRLQRLHVIGTDENLTFAVALSRAMRRAGDEATHLPLPNLRELALHRADFSMLNSQLHPPDRDRDLDVPDWPLRAILSGIFAVRQAAGLHLHGLHILSCLDADTDSDADSDTDRESGSDGAPTGVEDVFAPYAEVVRWIDANDYVSLGRSFRWLCEDSFE
jgi:hypothetical protein